MSTKFSVPRGTADVLPVDAARWQKLEQTARQIFNLYGYKEIRTPAFEDVELFARSMGQTSDVVQKQMLQLQAQKNSEEGDLQASRFALRPEGTASVVRSYIENSLDKKEPLTKVYYLGAMFRGERPQKGRLRQFHQLGAEAIGPGTGSPSLDAEMIAMSVNILKALGIKEFQLKINTLGAPEDKENFSKFLREQLKKHVTELCPDCQSRFERNVLRILDCKNKTCRSIVDKLNLSSQAHLSDESRKYFADVREFLDNLKIGYTADPKLVRGLDYYTHTVFEISCPSLGSQDALGAGGRYNNLVRELGGSEGVEAVGFALGIERILLALPEQPAAAASKDICVIAMDEASWKTAFGFADNLRRVVLDLANTNPVLKNVSVDMSHRYSASLKSQLRLADSKGSRFVALLGENELKDGSVTLKDMARKEQKPLPGALNDVSIFTKEIIERCI